MTRIEPVLCAAARTATVIPASPVRMPCEDGPCRSDPMAPSWHVLVAGTRLATALGDVPVDRITPGDLVMTRADGVQVVLDVVIGTVPRLALIQAPRLTPVAIAASALAAGLPCRELRLFPMTRVIVDGQNADAAAKRATDLVGEDRIARVFPDGVTYVAILLPVPAAVNAEGCWLAPNPDPGPPVLVDMVHEDPRSAWPQHGDIARLWAR